MPSTRCAASRTTANPSTTTSSGRPPSSPRRRHSAASARRRSLLPPAGAASRPAPGVGPPRPAASMRCRSSPVLAASSSSLSPAIAPPRALILRTMAMYLRQGHRVERRAGLLRCDPPAASHNAQQHKLLTASPIGTASAAWRLPHLRRSTRSAGCRPARCCSQWCGSRPSTACECEITLEQGCCLALPCKACHRQPTATEQAAAAATAAAHPAWRQGRRLLHALDGPHRQLGLRVLPVIAGRQGGWGSAWGLHGSH